MGSMTSCQKQGGFKLFDAFDSGEIVIIKEVNVVSDHTLRE